MCSALPRIVDLVLDDAHAASGLIGAPGQFGVERAVREPLHDSECGVLLRPPGEVTATLCEVAEQLVGAAEAGAAGAGKWLGDGVLLLARAPILAANTAWVPHSASETMRIWGKAAFPRPEWWRPNAEKSLCVAASSRMAPSIDMSPRPR